jgi:hypothetical protein
MVMELMMPRTRRTREHGYEITLELLEQIAAQRNFESKTLQIAKRLLIDGHAPRRLSSEFGVNHQRIYAIRKEVLAAAEQSRLPDGWSQITLAGPSDLIESTRKLFEQELADLQEAR